MKNTIKKILFYFWIKDKDINLIYNKIINTFRFIQNIYEKIKNKTLYILNIRNEFHYKLRKKILNDKEQFWINNFYQSYPPLNIAWDRNTIKRFDNYELNSFLDKNKEVLDIWGNLWFFSLYTSKFVKNIDIIEYNNNLCYYWNKVKDYENIKNVNIINWDFKKFNTDKKYDVIFSFAIHMWVWLKFENYLEKIHWLLKNNWYLFIESQDLNIDNFEDNIKKITNIYDILKIKDSNDHWKIKRKIAILKKKNNV